MTKSFDDYLINHVVFVLDASSSMGGSRADQLVKAAAKEIEYLAKLSGSDEMDQETRVAIYTFADTAKCVVPERDAMRLPTLDKVYRADGNTALIAATTLALDDINLVCQKYGNHAFLVYVLTDGEENRANYVQRANFPKRLAELPENVTLACMVPEGGNWTGGTCFGDAVKLGFPKGNVAVWNTGASDGVQKAVQNTMRVATTNFMQARTTGLRSTTSLFSMSTANINDATVKQALTPLAHDEYTLVPVVPPPASNNGKPWEIKQYAEHSGHKYVAGHTGYYQFVKTPKKPSEVVKPTKSVIVVEKKTHQAYAGQAARDLLGLPSDKEMRIRYDRNPDYDIYILSSSVNRHLVPGTNLLLLK